GDLQLSEPQYLPTNTSGLSRPPFCADLDGNGYNDIITVRALFYTGILTILYNDGNGNFVEEPQVGVNDNCILNIEDCELSNYPNPFNPTTKIHYSIKDKSNVQIDVYNLKGQLIKSLINGQQDAGDHSVIWKGNDDNGNEVSSGIYFYKLNVNGKTESVKKCILMK
ncbi:MAG: T9SS type A sorting domain-containing protein, partial [Candidatus Aenigmarchaeota archaeon]|nr:T9SS type A sorting domain-containing protein [Candidatus Aenigmarchaeota archaeon]